MSSLRSGRWVQLRQSFGLGLWAIPLSIAVSSAGQVFGRWIYRNT